MRFIKTPRGTRNSPCHTPNKQLAMLTADHVGAFYFQSAFGIGSKLPHSAHFSYVYCCL